MSTTWMRVSEDSKQTRDPALAALAALRDHMETLKRDHWLFESQEHTVQTRTWNNAVSAALSLANAAIRFRKFLIEQPSRVYYFCAECGEHLPTHWNEPVCTLHRNAP